MSLGGYLEDSNQHRGLVKKVQQSHQELDKGKYANLWLCVDRPSKDSNLKCTLVVLKV